MIVCYNNHGDLMRKTAIVTGCAKGIGKSIALDLARDGYNIIGTYNTSYDEVINLKNHIENIGVNCDLYKVDLSIEEDINNFLLDSDIEVVDIKFSVSASLFSDEQIYCFSALVMYNKVKK